MTTALLNGIGSYLSVNGLGNFSPDAPLPSSGWGISVVNFPQSPDLLMVLTPYNVGDEVFGSDSTVGVQVRFRGDRDPRTVQDRSDAVFGVLQGLHGVSLGGVPVVVCNRTSGVYLGPDTNGRHERADNYYFAVAWPTALRVS